jgi:hypothetical protein
MNDALDRLKNRHRPTVPSRDATLTPGTPDISTSRYPEQQISDTSDKPNPLQPPGEPNAEPSPLVTKQSTLRLESGLSDRLQRLCRENAICREVLIEAMFEYCQANPSIQEAVIESARSKNEHRSRVANHRRAKAMMKRFGA